MLAHNSTECSANQTLLCSLHKKHALLLCNKGFTHTTDDIHILGDCFVIGTSMLLMVCRSLERI